MEPIVGLGFPEPRPGRLRSAVRGDDVQKSQHSAGRRPEVRLLGVVNDAVPLPTRAPAPTSTPPPPLPPRARVPAPRHGAPTGDDASRQLPSFSVRASRFDAHPGRDGSGGVAEARAGSRSRGGGEEARAAEGGETCTSGTWRSRVGTIGRTVGFGREALVRRHPEIPRKLRRPSDARSVSSLDGRDVTPSPAVQALRRRDSAGGGSWPCSAKVALAHLRLGGGNDPPEVATNAMPRVAT